MQGSIAISPSPIIMDSLLRQKISLCLSGSVPQVNNYSMGSNPGGCAATARCLFGPPDPIKLQDLVREVELKNALNFGKRYNFDIVKGEPFPHAKKMKMSPSTIVNDSDEENVAILEEEEDDGYIWTETYEQDYMAMCNKHAMAPPIIGLNGHAVSLLIAPIIPMSNHPSSYPSSLSPSSTISSIESPGESEFISSDESGVSSSASSPSSATALALSTSETNNNTMDNNKNHHQHDKSSRERQEKRNNRINSLHSQNHQPSAKKSTLSSAHHILTKYTNRVLKHAVMKKPRKSVITDYLKMRRVKNGTSGAGKK